MPATYQSLLSRIDMALGEPHPSHPSQPQRWEALRGNVQLLFNITANTPVSWAVEQTTLTVTAGTSLYTVSAADFGKDILVETYDSSDSYHQPAVIARCSIQSLLLGNFPAPSYSVNGTPHTARAMAFYRESGVVYVRVDPVPEDTATYRIWYEVDAANMESQQNELLISHGETYLVNLAALQLLPLTRWAGLSPQENNQQRQNLGISLRPLVAMHEREYRLHVATDRDAGRGLMMGFDDAEYANDY